MAQKINKIGNQPTAGILVIGDEILSGRTMDSNSNYLAKKLSSSGINLLEVRVLGDEEKKIIETINHLRINYNYVFTSGGIGPTHDDITAEAIAKAFDVPLKINEEAVKLLATNYPNGEKDINTARLRMCRIPESATLIKNPISKAPGFSLENVFVMAGVPMIFKAMADSVVPELTGGPPLLSISLRVEKGEGDIATKLSEIAKEHSEISIGSYPFNQNGKYGTIIVARHTNMMILKNLQKKLHKLLL